MNIRQKPTVTELPQLGTVIKYSDAVYTSYRSSLWPATPKPHHIEHQKTPSYWVMDVQQSLFGQTPTDPTFSGLLGILKEIFPVISDCIDPKLIEKTYFPGAGILQELPLVRAFFPNIKAVAVDPLPMLTDEQFNYLRENNIEKVLGPEDAYLRSDASKFELPTDTSMVIVRHPHQDQLQSCWTSVFENIKKNPNWKVLLLTSMHHRELYGSNTFTGGFKSIVECLKENGDKLYIGTSPDVLPLVNPEGDPPAGIDLYYALLIRSPQQNPDAQTSSQGH